MGGDSDLGPGRSQPLDVIEVCHDGVLAKAGDAAAAVGHVEKDEGHAGLGGCVCGGERLVEPDVVELADRRVARGDHLPVGVGVAAADAVGRQPAGLDQHRLSPGPEVAALHAPAHRALEGVAVRVHEARELQPLGHACEPR